MPDLEVRLRPDAGARDASFDGVKPTTAARVAAVLFLAQALFPVLHQALGGHYWGFTHGHDLVIDAGLATLWGGAAVASLIHRWWPGFLLVLAGSLASLIHGMMYSLVTGIHGPVGVGIPFLVAAGIEIYCWVLAASAFLAPQPAPTEKKTREPRFWRRRHEAPAH
jgi:hypothetical protein